jgi:hypothetical protein
MVRFFLLLALALSAIGPARADIVYLPTDQGAERFHRAAVGTAALSLLSYFETEERQSFCGPTSLAIALDSMGIADPTPAAMFPYHLLTQDTVFTPQNLAVKSYARVEGAGLTLDELGKFAANLGVGTEVIHAADVSPDALRSRLRAALADPNQRVIVNYSRVPLGQEGAGHISPLAAYDAQTDSFLVLDVARYKYTPAWVSYDLLLAGMLLVDSDSKLSRGAVILTKPKP